MLLFLSLAGASLLASRPQIWKRISLGRPPLNDRHIHRISDREDNLQLDICDGGELPFLRLKRYNSLAPHKVLSLRGFPVARLERDKTPADTREGKRIHVRLQEDQCLYAACYDPPVGR